MLKSWDIKSVSMMRTNGTGARGSNVSAVIPVLPDGYRNWYEF